MTAINSNRAIRGPVTAVPVVAGKGVRLVADTDNNRWVVEADETVLWEGAATSSMSLSETPANFEYLQIYITRDNRSMVTLAAATASIITFGAACYDSTEGFTYQELVAEYSSSNGTTFNLVKTYRRWWNGSSLAGGTSNTSYVTKIVGVNRIASA